MESLERDIVAYFKSRNEDSTVKINQAQRPPPAKAKPFVAAKTQPHRSGGFKPTTIPSSKWSGSSRPHVWSSGPSGTHVDDHNPYWDQCSCPGHHHHSDNHDCPCSPHHMDDQHCWNPSENEHHHHHHHDDEHHHHHHDDEHHHHHHDDKHHHHHTDDQFGGHYPSHEHEHHGGGSNVDNSGYNYEHSSGGGYDYQSGGGFGNTGYGGPGSFY